MKPMTKSTRKSPRPAASASFLMPVLIALAFVGSSCGGSTATEDTSKTADTAIEAATESTTASAQTLPGIRLVNVAEAQTMLTDPDVTVIDVRTPEEFATGYLAGAKLVDFNAPDFAERIAEFDRSGRYLVYCRSGNRSGQALKVMSELGFTDVADLDGGILAWNEAGAPITK